MAGSPIDQFKIHTIGEQIVIGGLDISFSNAALIMVVTSILIFAFFHLSLKRMSIVPSKLQMASELSYNFVADIAKDNIGNKASVFFPLVFSLFLFILFGNLLGVIPYIFPFTSHIAVALSLATLIFLVATIYGIIKNGFKFFKIFLPSGIPIYLAPLMIFIEIISYFAKAFSMGVRLFANIMAGHIILDIFAGFVVTLGLFGIIPFSITVILCGFEMAIACLQAYVFTLLACLFIQQAIEFH